MDRQQQWFAEDLKRHETRMAERSISDTVKFALLIMYTSGWWDAAGHFDPTSQTVEISPVVAHHVIWHYGQQSSQAGYEPGDFVTALLRTVTRADDSNRARLSRAFPEYVLAATMIEREENGFDMLHRIAMSEVKQ